MKRLKLILLIGAIIGMLASCSESGKLKSAKVLATGEKVIIHDVERDLYVSGDTVVVYFDRYQEQWNMDKNWLKFDGPSYRSMNFGYYHKAVIL